MFDKESDEAFMCAKRSPMNAQRRFRRVIAVFIGQIESARLCEIDLVSRDSELPPDHAPDLDVDLGPVEGSFVGNFNVVDSGILEHTSRHLLRLFPKLRFIDEFCAELRR